jgi:hypothetical protein
MFLVLLMVAGSLAWLAGGTEAAPGADWSRLQSRALDQASLAEPEPFGEIATAGPWEIVVEEVVTGGDATDLVLGASDRNEATADGFQYVAVRLSVTNVAAQAYRVDFNDFGVVGESGIVRRFIGAIPPDPALDATVAPGASADGWIVAAAGDGERDLTLIYDSASLQSGWAGAAIALEPGASYAAAQDRAMRLNRIGRDPGQPAAIGAPVATRQWVVELVQVVYGADVLGLFPQSDFRTLALESSAPGTSTTWIAFQVQITNNATGDRPAWFPASAFTLADGDGNPVPDVLTLSAPSPDAAGMYLPGATRAGWVVFDVPPSYGGSLLRFQPFRTDGDPRFLTWGGGGVQAPAEPSFEGTLAEGSTVRIIEDEVNMRSAPTTDAEIVEVVARGTELTVTGPPEEGAGLTWYPVRDLETGLAGYVAQQFLEPAD